MMRTRFLGTVAFVILAALPAAAGDPPVIPLWENGPPGFEGRKGEAEVIDKGTITNIHYPTLTVFLPEPERATGVGVVVAPGGGLAKLGFQGGGVEPARFLAERGFAAFVLKYRLPREPGVPYKFEEHSLQDGQRAVFIALRRGFGDRWQAYPNGRPLADFRTGPMRGSAAEA